MTDYSTFANDTFFLTAEYCLKRGVFPDSNLMCILRGMDAVKSLDFYARTLTRLVKSLYDGNIDQLQFIQVFEDLLKGQMTAAWLDGMAANDLTADDMTDEWQAQLDNIIDSENSHVFDFSNDIVAASDLTGEPIDPLLARVDLWAARYTDVMNQAKLATAGEKDKLKWIFGETEKHCDTCRALNGIIATKAEWDISGFVP
jgi:hypothetical protein